MITEFTHIIFVRSTNVRNAQPGTIYIDAMGRTAMWQCPCGCGSISRVKVKKCKVFDPYERFILPEGVAGYEFSDDGEISFASVFINYQCPKHLVYGIEHNKVIVHSKI